MIARKIFLGLTTLLFLMGCTKKLTDSERAWNPYSLNEVLVFESSEKELDTLVIQEIYDAVSDGPTPKLYYHTYLIIHRKLKPNENQFARTDILSISSSTPKKSATINFPLYFENANFSGWGLELKDLEKYPLLSLSTKAGTFNDIIKLESVWYHPEREDEVQFMYWSKKHGYIKFERADGFTWELVDKYIPK